MDSYRKALIFWQAQPARQRHWVVLGVLTLACIWVWVGLMAPRWTQVQQAPQHIQQLQRQWEEMSGMAQTLKQRGGSLLGSTEREVGVSDEALLQTLRQMLDGCGQIDLTAKQLSIALQQCSAAQIAQANQWLDSNTSWLTARVELEAVGSNGMAWQGQWVWQR
jgi:type II secretory pathway component PulM